ncbi:MAG: isocitrate lyase/phosphoenolpyruvate mutase family protein [Opitutae bacterium]|nr:isocitrate lyase/phosphoenolpyruvate mutase family protein [Opitutae bacterium]
MNITQAEKAKRFRALHAAPGIFVIPNPWDAVSARLLVARGFTALATSSAAAAALLGKADNTITRDEALAHARLIAGVVDVPVSADLENGFGAATATVAETIRLAAGAGLAGGSIEDSSGDPVHPLYDLNLAVERVAAAGEAARSTGLGFVLTARTENLLHDVGGLDETVRRLQAYERAGADVLFAPGLRKLEDIRAVCAAVKKPVNFMGGMKGMNFTVAELAAAGVKRISLAASLYRAALTGVDAAAREIRDQGTFTYASRILTSDEVRPLLRP